jgi:hypothetical protein
MRDKREEETEAREAPSTFDSARWGKLDALDLPVVADGKLLDRELYLNAPCREGNRYPRQLNYHGHYHFAGTGKHVWFESLLESRMLMHLDREFDIVAIASQPMELTFADGSIHFPDFIALHANGRQVVYDVKPLERIDEKVTEQFDKTRALCETVGWGYEVLTGLPDQVQTNLTWLSYFNHPAFHPGQEAVERLVALLAASTVTVGEAASALELGSLARGRSALYNLAWSRIVTFDMAVPLSDSTLVKWNDNADR